MTGCEGGEKVLEKFEKTEGCKKTNVCKKPRP